ncbi:hypothetical protein K0M31_002029 [Melipona bicolor]|uniref:Uncharacterized protein n=1 Tax=Melipona bicolor TaxID=60889 RepID=A0AA40KY58_9HYME|nr:hypothetical protein K0M31_002029 [Melipona bicolor]
MRGGYLSPLQTNVNAKNVIRNRHTATREKHDRKKMFVPQNVRRRGNEKKKGKKELEGKSSNEEKTETTRAGCG